MNPENSRRTKILSRIAAEDFVGRTAELDRVIRHAQYQSIGDCGLLLLSPPATGASQLLKQTYDQLFSEQGEIVPFYFVLKPTDKTAKDCAQRFLHTFLLQTIAFRQNNATLLYTSPEISEIAERASADEAQWFTHLVKSYESENKKIDERAFVRNCLSAPLRAAASGTRFFVMIDDLHHVENFEGETNFIEELKEIYSQQIVRYVFGGRRRFLLKASQSGSAILNNPEILRLDIFLDSDTELLIENLSKKYSVEINEETRDLLCRQFNSNLLFIESIFIAAGEQKINLDSFQNIQQTYIDELFGGRIRSFYDSQFRESVENSKTQIGIVRLLHETLKSENKKSSRETWAKQLNVSDDELSRILNKLHISEIINFNSGTIEAEDENSCLCDYIEARFNLEISSEQRALVVGEHLAKSLEDASDLLSRFYRRASAINLRGLLGAFRNQLVPTALLDYAKFKEIYKGSPESEIFKKFETDEDQINLPQIFYTASGIAFYPPLGVVASEERVAVAFGVSSADYRKENEIVWIAAQIDSKLEATAELAEFWCDRLEMVAVACDFSKYRLWLIAPEGFAPEAIEILNQRNAYGTSRAQINLLVKILNAEDIVKEKPNMNEYEMTIPMGDNTELIAAHAVEEIARRYDFKPKAITQIKTALVEACINATEHSYSPDGKIHQKFTIEDDKIILTISNRGIKMPSEKVVEMTSRIESNGGRRGWGLKLMRTLMDEVKFEQVDDGTRISMVKYLK